MVEPTPPRAPAMVYQGLSFVLQAGRCNPLIVSAQIHAGSLSPFFDSRSHLGPGHRLKRAMALWLANGRQTGFDSFDWSQVNLSTEGVDYVQQLRIGQFAQVILCD